MPAAPPIPRPGSVGLKAFNLLTRANVALYRASGGRLGGTVKGAPVLLLDHVGRKTGTHRVTPLLYLEDGDDLILGAARAGSDAMPILSFVDPDVEWHSLILEIEGTRHGHDEVREWWKAIRTTFPDWSPAIVAVRDLGDWVAIHARGAGTGAASGVGVEYDFWQVAKFQAGRMVCYHGARTEDEALEAAGLSE